MKPLRRVRSGVLNSMPSSIGHRYNVTLSHKYNLIWFRVAKVGTRSVLALMQDADAEVIINYPKWRSLQSKGMNNYSAVSFVRNPYDRLVSAWKNKIVDKNLFRLDAELLERLQCFDLFVEYVSQFDLTNADVHLRPQYRLMDINRMNHIGKMESFNEDCHRIFGGLGIKMDKLSRANASSPSSKSSLDYYSSRSMNIVNKIYARDFQEFGYIMVD